MEANCLGGVSTSLRCEILRVSRCRPRTANKVRLWGESDACLGPRYFHKWGCLAGLTSLAMKAFTSRACHHYLLIRASQLWPIDLYLLMLGTNLVTKRHCATARGLVRSIENKRVLSINFAIDITGLLKVIRNRKTSKDSSSILFTRYKMLMLVIRNVTCRKLRLTHFVIVSIIDDWVLLLYAPLHSDWFSEWRRRVLCFMMLW